MTTASCRAAGTRFGLSAPRSGSSTRTACARSQICRRAGTDEDFVSEVGRVSAAADTTAMAALRIRVGRGRLCLVILGVRLDGTKEVVALADGYRESTAS